jgi:glyoxylase-like metal-dependent hydrolase (beta-lactamase superfamily II)
MIIRKSLLAFCLSVTLSTPAMVLAEGAPTDSAAYKAAAESRTPEDPNLVWTASHVALLAEEIAPSVHAVYPDTAQKKNDAGMPEATSGGFVIGETGVLVIDSMLNQRLAEQVIALIREKTDKPIRYVVNTSYHGDHSYGNQFFPGGTEIIQHRATRDYIRDHFDADIAFMEQNFGTNQGLDELRPVPATILLEDDADMTLDLGGAEIRIRRLGFAQTAGDLFVTTAQGKVVFTGNPVIASAPALPWLLDGHLVESIATMKALRDTLPDDAIVVPGHGAPTGVAAIEYHITYLEELSRQVEAAIAAGKSREDTVKAVAMPDYAGYKLHPWVHLQVNVPAAYDELSGK